MAIEGPQTEIINPKDEAERRARVADAFAAWNAEHPDGCLPLDIVEAGAGVVAGVAEAAAKHAVDLPRKAARIGGAAVRSLSEFSPIAAR